MLLIDRKQPGKEFPKQPELRFLESIVHVPLFCEHWQSGPASLFVDKFRNLKIILRAKQNSGDPWLLLRYQN